MSYENYFLRVQDCRKFDDKQYSRQIVPPVANKKDLNLYKDCFANHTEYVSPNTSILMPDNKSTSRYIPRDNLSSFFINEIYKPPKILEYNLGKEIEINYKNFTKEFAECSFYTPDKGREGFKLGSNRIRYIVGDIGQGKSAFIRRIYSDLYRQRSELDNDYEVISVYMDLEKVYNYSDTPTPLMDKFESSLFKKIKECLIEAGKSEIVDNLRGINPHNDPRVALKLLVLQAKKRKIRFLIYIDNLDFYHYFYARYYFFETGNKQQQESIIENISWLVSSISDPESLGHLGLNILIAVRSYVYDEIIVNRQGISTDTDSTLAVRLGYISDNLVISSRIDLFAEAAKVILKEKPGATDLKEVIQYFKMKFVVKKIDEAGVNTTPLVKIYGLGQHGYRSLVHFISSLNLTLSNRELFDRFFDRQASSLYILYFNNMYWRYTQEKDHFPNMFLVDCTVMDGSRFPEAHQPHMHTYWLKYFILKYIYKHKDDGVKFDLILEIFHKIGRYDDHLVRHVVGSLCTANEFRCAETKLNQVKRPFSARKIYPTKRGIRLMEGRPGTDMCFDFLYIQTVMDDQWLSYPKEFFDRLYEPSFDYSHLYDTGSDYKHNSIKSVSYNAQKILLFLRVLSSAFKIEIKKQKPELYRILEQEKLVPNFYVAKENIINSTKGALSALNDTLADDKIKSLENESNSSVLDHRLDEFFKKYYASDAKVSP